MLSGSLSGPESIFVSECFYKRGKPLVDKSIFNKSDRKPRLLVVGSMNMDLCMYGITRLPGWGESSFSTEYRYASGGKGANQALACSRLGAETFMVGRIGRDDNGDSLMESLAAGGVNTEYVVRDPKLNTGLSTMNMADDGRYFSFYVRGANMALCPEDVDRALAAFSPDMIVMQLEMPESVILKICEIGRKVKIPVFLDAGPAQAFPLELLNGAFIISPNEAETKALTGIDPLNEESMEAAAEKIYRTAHPAYVLLKLGSRGAYLYSERKQELIPGYSVEAVDTTAAGDTFGAAFCVRYCQGTPMEEAIRYAHAAAAICVTRKGGQPSIPNRQETEVFWKEHKM